MLLDLRDGIRNSKRLKYILIGIICVPFALVGIGSYFGNSGASFAAKVNGQKVPVSSFQNAYEQSTRQMQQRFGGQLPEGLDLSSMVNNQAMGMVVRQEVLRQSTAGNGFAVGDESLAQELISVEAFTVDGVFDKDRYTRQLQSMGVSPAEFEEQFRGDLLLQQFRDGIVSTGFSLSDENARVESLRSQKRLASFITLDAQAKADSIEVSDEEVTTHYDANIANFNNPEKVKVEYLEIKVDNLKEAVDVNEEDLQAYFEQYKSQWVVPEKRDASHILLELDRDASDSAVEEKQAEAEALIARIAAGETLASLAPDYSDDPGTAENGGSLGEFGRGVMVPEFDEVAFAIAEGELSEPVRSDFGFHIIQVDKIVPEKGQTYDEVKSEVEDKYRTELAETEYFEASERLSNAAYENNDSLQPAADETGFELKTSDWIDRNSQEGLGAFPQVLGAALTDDVLNNGLNSEVLEVGENHAVVLRTIEHEEAKPKPVDEVREDIVKRVQSEKAAEELQALADTMVGELEGGADASAVAEQNQGEFTDAASIDRTNADVDRIVLNQLFRMPKPDSGAKSYATVTDSNGDVIVVSFAGIDSTVPEGEAATTTELTAAPAPANAEFSALVSAIEGAAKVEHNEALLNPPEHYGGGM